MSPLHPTLHDSFPQSFVLDPFLTFCACLVLSTLVVLKPLFGAYYQVFTFSVCLFTTEDIPFYGECLLPDAPPRHCILEDEFIFLTPVPLQL